jgi:hypothetical protein
MSTLPSPNRPTPRKPLSTGKWVMVALALFAGGSALYIFNRPDDPVSRAVSACTGGAKQAVDFGLKAGLSEASLTAGAGLTKQLLAYFSDRGRLFQADRGRRNGAVGDALGKRASSGLNVSQSSTISLKRAVVGAWFWIGRFLNRGPCQARRRRPERACTHARSVGCGVVVAKRFGGLELDLVA